MEKLATQSLDFSHKEASWCCETCHQKSLLSTLVAPWGQLGSSRPGSQLKQDQLQLNPAGARAMLLLAPSAKPGPAICPALAGGSCSLHRQSPLMCHVCLTIAIKQHVKTHETRTSHPTSSTQLSLNAGELTGEEREREGDRMGHRVGVLHLDFPGQRLELSGDPLVNSFQRCFARAVNLWRGVFLLNPSRPSLAMPHCPRNFPYPPR